MEAVLRQIEEVNKMKGLFSILLILMVTGCAFMVPMPAAAQGSTQIGVVSLDSETFVTVQETGTGDVLSLYKIRGERIYLVDTVFNSTSRDVKLPKRYLHHVDVDNR